MVDTLDMLLDAAEINIRQKGYNAVSFRELADGLGIKSASVHYYFRKKEDLGIALIERYSNRFFETLNRQAAKVHGSQEKLHVFCQTYKQALVSSNAICLCGILGAETCSLPEMVARKVAAFFEANIKWLEDELSHEWTTLQRRCRSRQVVATLQGAMMLSISLKNPKLFDQAVKGLCSDLFSQ